MVKMIDYKESMMDEIEEAAEIAKLDNMQACQMAFHYANADWDCVPDEYKIPHDSETETAFKNSRFEYHLEILLEEMDVGHDLIDLISKVNEVDNNTMYAEHNGQSYIVKSVFLGSGTDIQTAVLNLAKKKAAREMGIG